MKKDLLFIAGVHGDEKIGIDVLSSLEKKFAIDWIKGNEKALEANKRYIKNDLNRVAPGKSNSMDYETKRAFQIIQKSQQYKYTIDIHGTTANSGIFVIVTNPTIQNLAFATALPIDNIVIWVAKKKEVINPLSEYYPCGIEIECGPKNSERIAKKLKQIVSEILTNGVDLNKAIFSKKRFFQVYDFLPKDQKVNIELIDFNRMTFNNEVFYPILSNQYQGIACYKMKEINYLDLFAY